MWPSPEPRLAFFCRATFTEVPKNGMRPGYDCRCSGCLASIGQSVDAATLREMQRQAGGR